MAPSAQAHSRSHSLLLLQKLLNLRDSASPFTLILDSLEQTAGPLVKEFTSRAKISKSKVIFVSFASLKKPRDADIFIKARCTPLKALRAEIVSHCSQQPNPAAAKQGHNRVLIIIDSLNTLAASSPRFLSAFLSSIIAPLVSVVAIYHADVPLILSRSSSEYEPHPLTVVSHLSTAIVRVSSLYQAVERKRARDRSLQEPGWGLHEGLEGVLVGIKGSSEKWTSAGVMSTGNGIVIDMELRRRSGRSVTEKFVLTPPASRPRLSPGAAVAAAAAGAATASISLLSDHPVFARPPEDTRGGDTGADDNEDEDMGTTFSLGLTDKQRKDREAVVLPYFDAQTEIGGGEGGRILYDMGREDDFDDEEDEI